MSQPSERPCLHERGGLVAMRIHGNVTWREFECADCEKRYPEDYWHGWEAAMAAVRALPTIPAIGMRFGDRVVPISEHDAWPREGLIEEGKSYLLVALPTEEATDA